MLNGGTAADEIDRVPPSRRAFVLLATAGELPPDEARTAAARHAHAEREHLCAALASSMRSASVSVLPALNPMAGTTSMMGAPDYAAAVTVDLADDTADDALLRGLDGFADRHGASTGGDLALDRSSIVIGRFHHLRERPAPSGTEPLKVLVALRPMPGLSVDEFHERWLTLGRVNARNHPTCSMYGQLHADVELTARAMERSGLTYGPFDGLALEVFPSADDLHAGHGYAKAPGSLDGSSVDGENLMALLGQVLDFGSSGKLLAVDEPSSA